LNATEERVNEEVESEPVLLQQPAGRLAGGVNLMGGTLMLTRSCIVFIPVIQRAALKRSSQVAGLSQHLHGWHIYPQKLLNAAIMPLTKPVKIPLNKIEKITASRRCALLISWTDSTKLRTMEFGISATRFSTIWNPENIASRDRVLAAINTVRQGRSLD
jgi:hypothetical protein